MGLQVHMAHQVPNRMNGKEKKKANTETHIAKISKHSKK